MSVLSHWGGGGGGGWTQRSWCCARHDGRNSNLVMSVLSHWGGGGGAGHKDHGAAPGMMAEIVI